MVVNRCKWAHTLKKVSLRLFSFDRSKKENDELRWIMMNYLFSSFDVADVDRKVLRLIEFYKYYLIIQVLFNNTSKMLS